MNIFIFIAMSFCCVLTVVLAIFTVWLAVAKELDKQFPVMHRLLFVVGSFVITCSLGWVTNNWAVLLGVHI